MASWLPDPNALGFGGGGGRYVTRVTNGVQGVENGRLSVESGRGVSHVSALPVDAGGTAESIKDADGMRTSAARYTACGKHIGRAVAAYLWRVAVAGGSAAAMRGRGGGTPPLSLSTVVALALVQRQCPQRLSVLPSLL